MRIFVNQGVDRVLFRFATTAELNAVLYLVITPEDVAVAPQSDLRIWPRLGAHGSPLHYETEQEVGRPYLGMVARLSHRVRLRRVLAWLRHGMRLYGVIARLAY